MERLGEHCNPEKGAGIRFLCEKWGKPCPKRRKELSHLFLLWRCWCEKTSSSFSREKGEGAEVGKGGIADRGRGKGEGSMRSMRARPGISTSSERKERRFRTSKSREWVKKEEEGGRTCWTVAWRGARPLSISRQKERRE